MSEQHAQHGGAPPAGLGWLRARLLPGGTASLMVAAYAMVLASLVTFVLNQRDLPAPQFYLGLIALGALFVLHVVMVDLERLLGERRAGLLHLGAGGALWALVTWISLGSGNFNFVPFLLFMLVAQAIVILPFGGALLYTLALLATFSAALGLHGFSAEAIASNLVSLSTGLVFVAVFSTVLNLYRRQTERAETLLAQLSAANAELEAARRRDRELAVAEERVRLARDIHDGLGHHLTALNVQLQAAARLLERDPVRAAAAIATSREVAQAALDEVRQSVAVMRRTPLDGQSLPDALATLAVEFARRAELRAALDVRGAPVELSPAAAQTLYRAAQEGLTNAQKHGAAHSVRLLLDYGAQTVALDVEDDGAATGPPGPGFGLAGLRERAEQLGGSLVAGPREGGGFALRLEFPTVRDEEQQ
jgi:signal transduction histidine kinase